MSPYGRACLQCTKAKVRCALTDGGDRGSCERCVLRSCLEDTALSRFQYVKTIRKHDLILEQMFKIRERMSASAEITRR